SAGSTRVSPTQSIDKPTNLLGRSEQAKKHTKNRQKTSKGQCHSKNLVAERNRRHRINDGLFALRALVPKISKMNRAAIVGDAIDYIKELQTNIQELQQELERLEEDDSKSNVDELEVCKPKEHSLVSTTSDRKTEAQVEVYQIGAKDFLLKLVCGKQQGGFQRMIEIVNSLGLQVLDINVTTCYDKVLNILKVEAKGKHVAAKSLKDSLLDSWMPRVLGDNTRLGD
ncbi:transcription factor ABORTED MICROSPORES-like, partial [Bidens hawaiensis]|uniref:transcription factor ABORTED MICROSPORES-like n=1 Tax=Bidens hawaiensis TaxID=980011 RepID=UPI00404AC2DA